MNYKLLFLFFVAMGFIWMYRFLTKETSNPDCCQPCLKDKKQGYGYGHDWVSGCCCAHRLADESAPPIEHIVVPKVPPPQEQKELPDGNGCGYFCAKFFIGALVLLLAIVVYFNFIRAEKVEAGIKPAGVLTVVTGGIHGVPVSRNEVPYFIVDGQKTFRITIEEPRELPWGGWRRNGRTVDVAIQD
jgi:hypothetical protein